MFVFVHVRACRHSAWKHARYFCDFFTTFFWYICCQFLVILKPFPTENEKTEATLQIGIDVAQLFSFIHFFHFGKEVLQNGRNVSKNGQNSTILTPGGQNMQLRNKSHKIKKFPYILRDKMQFLVLFFFSFQSGSPLKWPKKFQKW